MHQGGDLKLDAFLIRWPRGGRCILWQPFTLYAVVGMTSYSGQPSKGVWESIPRWRRTSEEVGLVGHLFKSSVSTQQSTALASCDQFLPYPALTTIAYLFLLLRLSRGSARKGWLRPVEKRGRLWTLLVSFLDVTLVSPSAVSAWQAQLRQQHDLGGDLRPAKFKWFALMQNFVDDKGYIQLKDLLAPAGAATNSYEDLILHLLWHISQRLEAGLYRSADQDIEGAQIFLARSAAEELWGHREVDRCCAKHWEACKRACANITHIGISTSLSSLCHRRRGRSVGLVVFRSCGGLDHIICAVTSGRKALRPPLRACRRAQTGRKHRSGASEIWGNRVRCIWDGLGGGAFSARHESDRYAYTPVAAAHESDRYAYTPNFRIHQWGGHESDRSPYTPVGVLWCPLLRPRRCPRQTSQHKVVSHVHTNTLAAPEKELETGLDMQRRHKRFLERSPGDQTSSFRPKKSTGRASRKSYACSTIRCAPRGRSDP